MTTDRQARLDRALEWQRSTGSGAPPADDVEVVARLGVIDRAVAQELIVVAPAALLAHWDDLQRAIAGEAVPPGVGPSTEPIPESIPGPTPERSGEPEPDAGPGSSLSGLARARFDALSAWVAAETAAGNALDLGDRTLQTVAQLDPGDRNFAKRLVPQLRTYAPQIAEVMRSGHVVEEPTAPVPLETSAAVPQMPPAPADSGSRSGTVEPTGFSAYDYSGSATTPHAVSFAVQEDETLLMSWPRASVPEPVQLYRVVTSTTYAPPAPELGDTLVATYDAEYLDSRRHLAAVLHVTVWLNAGPTEEAARAAQPVLHAHGSPVLPVRNCVVRADGDAVVGQWQVADGVRRIDVERVPKHLVAAHPYYTHEFLVPPEMVSRGGFKDTGAPAGGDFVYRIYALAAMGDGAEELSLPISREVRIEAIIEPVRDLVVEPHEGSEDRFDLTWTMPVAGHVEIYRSDRPPASGIDAEVRDRSVIDRLGLSDDLRLVQQMIVEGGRGRMLDVPWPTGWSRAYFTPVTVLSEDQLQVGTYQVVTRARPLTHVRLVERVDEQFLTFAWPDGVTDVLIFQGPRGGSFVDPQRDTPVDQLNYEMYQKYGGAHLKDKLPAEGCTVHLVATTYARGYAQFSPAVSVDYPGLCRLSYVLEPVANTGGGRRKAGPPSTRRRLLVTADLEVTVPLVLVHHPERLPLSTSDGQIILRKELSFAPGAPVLFEEFDVGNNTGYLRLFAHVGRDLAHLRAVLDPALDQLRCG